MYLHIQSTLDERVSALALVHAGLLFAQVADARALRHGEQVASGNTSTAIFDPPPRENTV